MSHLGHRLVEKSSDYIHLGPPFSRIALSGNGGAISFPSAPFIGSEGAFGYPVTSTHARLFALENVPDLEVVDVVSGRARMIPRVQLAP